MLHSDVPGAGLTSQIRPKRGLMLDMVPHRARDAGDRPDGEEDSQPNFLPQVHFNFIQDNQRH